VKVTPPEHPAGNTLLVPSLDVGTPPNGKDTIAPRGADLFARSRMRPAVPTLVLAQLVLASFLCGLIWVVQGVLYPLFGLVGSADFGAFHTAEMNRISWIVAPVMSAELALTVWVLVLAPREPLAWAAAGLVALAWVSTGWLQVPLHQQLAAAGFDAERIDRLTSTNWLRTAAWTVRVGLLIVWTRKLGRRADR